jgi:hypothetical protein
MLLDLIKLIQGNFAIDNIYSVVNMICLSSGVVMSLNSSGVPIVIL